jgi:hypothetical protein
LHEDTLYGATQKWTEQQRQEKPREVRGHAKDWQEGDKLFVYRKPVEAIKGVKNLEEVRDRALRECLERHLRAMGVDPASKSYPPKVFEREPRPAMPSGMPIRKVRLVVEKTTLRPAGAKRGYQFVQPGNNHHIAYYEQDTPKGKKWNARVVTTWDASLRARRDKLPPVDTADDLKLGRFVMALSIGESFVMRDEAGLEQLYIVRKMDFGNQRLYFKQHTDARTAGELKESKDKLDIFAEGLRKRGVQKVLVTHLGEIRRAGD